MVLNRQLECGFSKGSPSLITTFVLSPRWAASWNACNCHWLEKMFICFLFNGKTGKLHFTSISVPRMPPPPPRMKLFGNQQLECLQGFFSRQKRIYILDHRSHHKKGSLPHNFQSFSNFSGYLVLGIWMYLFENITLFFVHFAGLGTFTRFPHSITLTKVSFPKLFGNQQLECLQGYIFSRQKHTHTYIYIYILDPPSHHKKGSLPHNFQSFSNFSGYLEVLGIRMCLFGNITFFFVHFAGLGTFTRFPHSITLNKGGFPYKNCDFGHIPEEDRLLGKEDTPSH